MKRILTLAIGACLVAATTNAQEMMSKKGTPILPEAGDWSIGIDAVPVINYFGNFFSNAGNQNTSYWNFADPAHPMTIVGKCMDKADANKAMRAKLRLGFGSAKQDTIVADNASTTGGTVVNETKFSGMNINLGYGMQWYRGKGRLKGFYGAELLLGISSGKTTYSYGNPLDTLHFPSPVVEFRTTENKLGSGFEVGLRGFVGVEYFFAPKMSLGGEFGWGLGLSSVGEGSMTTETFTAPGNAPATTKVTTTKTGKSSSFGVDTDNGGSVFAPTGAIMLSFYF